MDKDEISAIIYKYNPLAGHLSHQRLRQTLTP